MDTFYCSCGQDFEERQVLEIHKSRCSIFIPDSLEESCEVFTETSVIDVKEEFIEDFVQPRAM